MVNSLYLKEIKPTVPEGSYQLLHLHSLSECQKTSDAMLRVFLEFLEKYYPSTFLSENGKKETVDELLRKLSLINIFFSKNKERNDWQIELPTIAGERKIVFP
jgi:hypothetical protein